MKGKAVLIVASAFLLAWPAFGQTVPAQVLSMPDAPLQITAAECLNAETGAFRCRATVRINPTGRWSGFGLKWKLTLANGHAVTLSQFADAFRRPGPNAGAFNPGELSERESGGVGARGADGKGISVKSAEVQLDFAVPATGKAWGNTKSENYVRMMSIRTGHSQAVGHLRSVYAKEGADAVLRELGVKQ